MYVRFGNLSILQFEEKTEVNFNDKDFQWLNEHRQDSTDVKDADKFHIFDKPLGIVAGENCGAELVKRLKKYSLKRHFSVVTLMSED